MNKKKIFIILILMWMLVIFIFSSMNSNSSNIKSKGIINTPVNILNKSSILKKEISINDKKLETINLIFRKLMHFIFYVILSILVFYFLNEYDISITKKIMITVIICMLYATSDEIHQLFIDGRSGKFTDVLIDSLGSLTTCYLLIINHEKKHKNSF